MDNLIRKLASSFDTQITYARIKDGMALEFFDNKKDFTGVQIMFMYWMELYNGLYSSISTKSIYLNQAVISDDIRCDAYLKCRIKLEEDEERRNKYNKDRVSRKKNKKQTTLIPNLSVCMRQKKG